MTKSKKPILPKAPNTIAAGSSLAELLSLKVIKIMASNIAIAHPKFDQKEFIKLSKKDLKDLGIVDRGHHIAKAMKATLPSSYEKAIGVLLKSLTPPNKKTEDNGLAPFFYLPHVMFVANYGLDKENNNGKDPFEISMKAQYELTRRFSSEFSIRPYLIQWESKTLKRLKKWTKDKDPHVRRLCSEGTRPKLPWAMHLRSFIKDPTPVLPILETLKDDPVLYVRRSVANHLGDIAKDHPNLVFKICKKWLKGASEERKWLIRHALRHPAKKGNETALKIRKAAK